MKRTTVVVGSALTAATLALAGCSSSSSPKSEPTTPTRQGCPTAKAVTKAIDDKVETVKRTPSATSVACGYNSGDTTVIASITFGIKAGDLRAVANGLGSSRTVKPLTGIGDEAVQLPETSKDTLIIVVRYGNRAVTVAMDPNHDKLAIEKAFAKLFA